MFLVSTMTSHLLLASPERASSPVRDTRAVARAVSRLLHRVVPPETNVRDASGPDELSASVGEPCVPPGAGETDGVKTAIVNTCIASDTRPSPTPDGVRVALKRLVGRDVFLEKKRKAEEAKDESIGLRKKLPCQNPIAAQARSGASQASATSGSHDPFRVHSQNPSIPDARDVRAAVDRRGVVEGLAFLRKCHERLTQIVADAVLARARSRVFHERAEETKETTEPRLHGIEPGCARLVRFGSTTRDTHSSCGTGVDSSKLLGGSVTSAHFSKKSLARLAVEKSADTCFGASTDLKKIHQRAILPPRKTRTRNRTCAGAFRVSSDDAQAGDTHQLTAITAGERSRKRKGVALKGAAGVARLRATEKLFRVDRSCVHGFGVFPLVDVPGNTAIIEYVGEVLRRPVADAREREADASLQLRELRKDSRDQTGSQAPPKKASTYMFALDEFDVDSRVVDAQRKGNIARFVNHSCVPNCVTKNVTLHDKKRVVLFTKRPIQNGEELSYDYRFAPETPECETRCACGATGCRGVINVRGA